MIRAEFHENTLAVKEKVRSTVDLMMGLMAAGIEIQIKTSGNTPFQHGGLRGGARHVKRGIADYEIQDDREYAAAQEAGTTRGHKMVNYTTPGTGPHYFQKAVETVKSRQAEYATQAINATGGEL